MRCENRPESVRGAYTGYEVTQTLRKADGTSKDRRGWPTRKKGATGITTVAPSVAGQWGRGDNRLQE